jgi:hypothetical protein
MRDSHLILNLEFGSAARQIHHPHLSWLEGCAKNGLLNFVVVVDAHCDAASGEILHNCTHNISTATLDIYEASI